MLLFRENTSGPQKTAATTDLLAGTIAKTISRHQQQVALQLSKKFDTLSGRSRKGAFLLFCLLLGCACSSVLVQAVWPGVGIQPLSDLHTHFSTIGRPGETTNNYRSASFPPDPGCPPISTESY